MKHSFLIMALSMASPLSAQTINVARMNGGVNAQTGTSYAMQCTDAVLLTTFNNAAPVAVTLPAASLCGAGPVFTVRNLGLGNVTITPLAGTIDGGASMVLAFGQGADIYNNGANYFTNQGNNSGTLAGTAALKPILPNDAVQFISPNGNDANDGLSWGSAKLTAYKALQSLPGGSATQTGSGKILVSGVVNYGGPAANQGMWIMGGADPNSGAPPSGWLLKSTAGPIDIECAFPPIQFAHAHTPACTMVGGGNSDLVHPALWLSATSQISIKNIGFGNFLNTYAKIGIDSNNNRTTAAGGVSSVTLDGVSWNHGSCRFGGGPGLDIGSNTFWIWLRNINATGCAFGEVTIAGSGTPGLSRAANVVTVNTTTNNSIAAGNIVTLQNTTDPSFSGSYTVATAPTLTQFTFNQPGPNVAASGNGQVITAAKAAINSDATGGSGSGLIFLQNFQTNSGGIRIAPGNQGAGFYIQNGDYEGDGVNQDMPEVLVTSGVATSNGTGMNIVVDNVEISDAITTPLPGVRIDNSTIPAVKVSRVDGGVIGPALILGGTPNNGASDLSLGHVGFDYFGRVTAGGIDASRRGCSPVAVVSANLAAVAPASWVFETGAGTVTPTIADLCGTTLAGRVTSNAGTSIIDFYVLNNTPLMIGDTYIGGVWERSNSAGNLSGVVQVKLNSNGFGAGDICTSGTGAGASLFPKINGDGQWIWNAAICTVATNPANAGITLSAPITNPAVMDFFMPIIVKIPTGTKSTAELYEIANTLHTYSPTCTVGQICTMTGPLTVP